MGEKRAWITLIASNDYINGIICLLNSLKVVQTKYPIYVITTPNITEENKKIITDFYHANIIEEDYTTPAGFTKDLYFTRHTTEEYKQFHRGMHKLTIFKYVQFDKVVYVDADIVFLQNADELFDKPHMSAVVDDGFVGSADEGFFNAGVMVIKPDLSEYNRIISVMNSDEMLETNGLDDQDVLFKSYPNWKHEEYLHLDYTYNTIAYALAMDQYKPDVAFKLGFVKIFHMLGLDKVWKNPNIDYYKSRSNTRYLAIMQWYSVMINNCIQSLFQAGFSSVDIKPIQWTCIL